MPSTPPLYTPSSSALEGKHTSPHDLYFVILTLNSNTGTTNTFTPIDVANLTGGVYNSGTLLQGNNFACFVYQLSAQAKPDILGGLLDTLTDAVGKVVSGLSCPQLKGIDTEQLEALPGYTKMPVYG